MNLFIACLQETGDFWGRSGDERESGERKGLVIWVGQVRGLKERLLLGVYQELDKTGLEERQAQLSRKGFFLLEEIFFWLGMEGDGGSISPQPNTL